MDIKAVQALYNWGLSLIPIKPGSKIPLVKWEQYQVCVPTLEDVTQWFENEQDLNVAIVTGELSGVVVLDVDEHGDVAGQASLAAKGWTLPRTPSVKTGRGRHYYFRHPGIFVGNQVGLLPGVDFRGDGGYVVAPPSVHENGAIYEWEVGLDEVAFADLPPWFESVHSTLANLPKATRSTLLNAKRTRSTRYGLAALKQEVEELAITPEGGRNDKLFQASARAGELIGGGELTQFDAERDLEIGALTAGLKRDEIKATVSSGLKRGKKSPRTAPDASIDPITSFDHFPLFAQFGTAEPELAIKAMRSVKDVFSSAGYDHSPSVEQMFGLGQIAIAIEAMALGLLPNALFVSYLPPGAGKTSTLVQTIREMYTDEKFSDVGTIIFLSRCEEIEKMVGAMGLADNDFAVLTSRDEYNRLGKQVERDKAKVLFTTQQQLEARSRGTEKFASMDVFWFKGKPRQVRVWDEAILPSMMLTLGRYDLEELRKGFAFDRKSEITDMIDDFGSQLKASSTGSVLVVPDIQKLYGSVDAVRAIFKGGAKDAAETFWRLSKRKVRVRKDGAAGNTMLDYEDILPADLGPMLVLDASAQQRKTYEFWSQRRGGLVFLRSTTKDYSGLTVHHWDKGAGKYSQSRDDNKTIARGVARTINRDIPQDEPVLVIHHKRSQDVDFEQDLTAELEGAKDRVQFCHWGLHTATNEYSHIRHVILAGLLTYNAAQYEATARSAANLSHQDELNESDFESVRLGEIAHHVFQAANRGRCRKSVEDRCPDDCHLYAVFSTIKGVGVPNALLERVFPGASVVDWHPIFSPSGNYLKLVEFILKRHDQWADKISRGELLTALGIIDQSQLRRTLAHRDVIGALRDKGIELDVGTSEITLISSRNPNKLSQVSDSELDRSEAWAPPWTKSVKA